MKRLNELTYQLPCQIFGNATRLIKGISNHSSQTNPKDIFVAVNGFTTSGKNYIDDAIHNGAETIVTDDKLLIKKIIKKYNNVTAVFTKNPNLFLTKIANRFYGYPSEKLVLIGITGTDGKTTTSYMVKSIIEASGKKTGLIGTIKYYDGKHYLPARNTTPDTLEFIKFLANLVKNHIPYCVSEVSSHSLALGRVQDLRFKIAAFTNLTSDHLDFHKTRQAYARAKLKLFQNLTKNSIAVINTDDVFSKTIINNTNARLITYSLHEKSTLQAKIKSIDSNGIKVTVLYDSKKPLTINLPMLGEHNVYNMLAAIGVAQALKISNSYIKKGMENLEVVTGRLEKIKNNQGLNIYIDYAHTAPALKTAIQSLKPITNGKLIVVFGCGGNRDKQKRPLMGKIASQLSDYVIITSDNPRFEQPKQIIADITKGIRKNNFTTITNRRQAIKKAIQMATKNDTILIAGKGHEQYQIIGNKTIHFCDKEIVLNSLR